jgi:hypothetical protein
MNPVNDWFIPSFTAHGTAWRGAIYAMRPGLGPELVLECVHEHHTMRRATQCAETDLRFAKQVVALADERRPS